MGETSTPSHFDAERLDDELWPVDAPAVTGRQVVEVDTAVAVDVEAVAAAVRARLASG